MSGDQIDRPEGHTGRGDKPPIEIDRSDPHDRYRFTCPESHTSWQETDSHLWCRCCSESEDHDAVHWTLLDQKTDELIPFSDVEVSE